MAAAVLLQEWNTIRGVNSVTTITQQEQNYADLLHFQDVVIFMETSDVGGSPTITFETSPTKDNSLFIAMNSTATFVPTAGVTQIVLRYSGATVPLARYMRWRFTGATSAYSCTFRIWLSPNLS